MKQLLFFILLVISVSESSGQSFTVRTVKDNIFIPWEIIYGPDDNIWFTQKNGFVCRTDPGSGHTDTLYHETNNVIQSEGGMLGMALHPQFPTQPYIYAAYQYNQGGYKERIVRYTYYPVGDTLGADTTLLEDINGNNYHNGCRLVVVNDKLFITTGDAGNFGWPQNINSINGKVLRINLDGSIPGDNPIPGSPVWSWGDRNSQGMVYANGRLYTSMHGNNSDDEINIIVKGGNYGWPDVEGFCDQPGEMSFCNDSNVVEPIYAWTPTIAACGLDYYDHAMFSPWQNALIVTALKDTSIYILKLNGTHDAVTSVIHIDSLHIGRIRDICISPQGSIFLSTSNSPASGNGSKIDKIVELVDSSYYLSAGRIMSSGELQVYPNPTKNEVIITLKNGHIIGLKYTLSNSLGQQLESGTIGRNRLSLSTLPPGIYLLEVRGNDGEQYKAKILKE